MRRAGCDNLDGAVQTAERVPVAEWVLDALSDASGVVLWASAIHDADLTDATRLAAQDLTEQLTGLDQAGTALFAPDRDLVPIETALLSGGGRGRRAATVMAADPRLHRAIDELDPDLDAMPARSVQLRDGRLLLSRHIDADSELAGQLQDCGFELAEFSAVLPAYRYRLGERAETAAALTPILPSDPTAPEPELLPAVDRPTLAHDGIEVRSGIVVIVPTHNEARDIMDTLDSLRAQTLPADRIVVVSDNSTDETPSLVNALDADGIELIRTVNNSAKKSGALNAAFRHLAADGELPEDEISFVLTMDADTDLDPRFLEQATRIMERRPDVGGLSAACHGKPGLGDTPWQKIVIWFQRVEYGRYTYTRMRSNIHTMSGAGAFYRVEALNDLIRERGHVFDERPSNLVEDYETTLALKDAGWTATCNQHCAAYTDLMPTLRSLVKQRQRWVRGTIDELRRRGWPDSHTRVSVFQILFGIISIPWVYGWLGYSLYVGATRGSFEPVWVVLAIGIALWQAWSIRWLGPWSMLAAATLVPELLFGLVRAYWFFTSIARSYLTKAQAWE